MMRKVLWMRNKRDCTGNLSKKKETSLLMWRMTLTKKITLGMVVVMEDREIITKKEAKDNTITIRTIINTNSNNNNNTHSNNHNTICNMVIISSSHHINLILTNNKCNTHHNHSISWEINNNTMIQFSKCGFNNNNSSLICKL